MNDLNKEKRKMPMWLKGGIIFFLISLISLVLTIGCSFLAKEAHPDAGIICWLPALPLLPVVLVTLKFGLTFPVEPNIVVILILVFAIVLLYTFIGFIFGLLFEYICTFLRKKRSASDMKKFYFIIVLFLFVLALSSFAEAGWEKGHGHVHAGYSKIDVYSNEPNSGCNIWLEGNPVENYIYLVFGGVITSYEVAELADQVTDSNIKCLGESISHI